VKPVTTPMDTNAQYSIEQCPTTPNQLARMTGVLFSKVIGSVLWPAVVSRLDIVFGVGVLSQFVQNPGPIHWEALKRVIVYLNTTKGLWLIFGGNSEVLVEGYCDADWASQKHRHSISGYTFYLGQGVILWSLKNQHIIALSSTEAEYIAETHVTKEALWLQGFIDEVRGPRDVPI